MDVFQALADRTRRAILIQAARAPTRVLDLAEGHDMSRPAVSKHLRVLHEAGLITVEPSGRERLYATDLVALAPVIEFLNSTGIRSESVLSASVATPPIDGTTLDALDLEVRRTVKDSHSRNQSPQENNRPYRKEDSA